MNYNVTISIFLMPHFFGKPMKHVFWKLYFLLLQWSLDAFTLFASTFVLYFSLFVLQEYNLRGYPLQHTLIFCQFVESDTKCLGLKYIADSMLFAEVIKISKIEKMRFPNYFDACDESSSYLASRSYEALEKKLFTKNCLLGPPLPGDILSF